MNKVLLGDVAVEHKETCKGSKDGYPIVGLEHLIPEEITLTAWDVPQGECLVWPPQSLPQKGCCCSI